MVPIKTDSLLSILLQFHSTILNIAAYHTEANFGRYE